MRIFFTISLFIVLCGEWGSAQEQESENTNTSQIPEERDVYKQRTESGQFTIYGADFKTRAAFSSTLESTRVGILNALGVKEDDPWKWPIILQLHGKEGDKAPERLMAFQPLIVGEGWRFQLHVHLAKGIDVEALEREIIRALLMERGLRNVSPNSVNSKLNVPLWLLVGLEEAVDWKRGFGDRELYESVLKSGVLLKLEEMFPYTNIDSLDPATKTTFRVSAGALTISLIGKNNESRDAFFEFLAGVLTFDGEMITLLRENFPGMNLSQNSLVKWWQLQLANLSSPLVVDTMTIVETEERLEAGLTAYLRDETGGVREIPLSLWRNILTEPKGRSAIQQMNQSIAHMSYRCFPMYRPLLEEYQKLLSNLLQGETKSAESRIAELSQARKILLDSSVRARDYLDWYEINNGLSQGESFDGFVKLKEVLRGDGERKGDHLSQYLDDMQRFFAEE